MAGTAAAYWSVASFTVVAQGGVVKSCRSCVIMSSWWGGECMLLATRDIILSGVDNPCSTKERQHSSPREACSGMNQHVLHAELLQPRLGTSARPGQHNSADPGGASLQPASPGLQAAASEATF
jgi:hypothetical protein